MKSIPALFLAFAGLLACAAAQAPKAPNPALVPIEDTQDVHFHPDGSTFLGVEVAKSIEADLPKTK